MHLEGLGLQTVQDYKNHIHTRPDQYAQYLVDQKATIPDGLWHELTSGPDAKESVHDFFVVAESIIHIISRHPEDFPEFSEQKKMQDSYGLRSAVMHSPGYYNPLKLVRFVSRMHDIPDGIFQAYFKSVKKGKKGGKKSHSFMGSVHEGHSARIRILFSQEKHAPKEIEEGFQRIPALTREHFNYIEGALIELDGFSHHINLFTQAESVSAADPYVSRVFTSLVNFVNSNVTKLHDSSMMEVENKFHTNQMTPEDKLQFLQICHKAQGLYGSYLSHLIAHQSRIEDKQYPEVVQHKVQFSKEVYDRMTDKNNPQVYSDGIHEDFYNEKYADLEFRLAVIQRHIDNPGDLIPQEIIEQAIASIRLRRDVPLINVIGGARMVSEEQKGNLARIAEAIVGAGKELGANVSVPGTQSGLGLAMGEANLEYLAGDGVKVDHKDRMHMFAVTPSGATAYPGNEMQRPNGTNFALSPVDQIMTPIDPRWKVADRELHNINYKKQITYMENVSANASYDQSKMLVVGNGGYYSVLEVNDSLQYDFNLFLIPGTGRFAEVAGYLYNHHFEEMIGVPQAEFEKRVLDILAASDLGDDVVSEFLTKDFGHNEAEEADAFVMYRQAFHEFFTRVHNKKSSVYTPAIKELQGVLEEKGKKEKTHTSV